MRMVLNYSKFAVVLIAPFFAAPSLAQNSFNEQIKAVDSQYQSQIFNAQNALSQANLAYTRCGMEANKGADGKANPDLEEAPNGTMAMLQNVLPGVMQMAPALPEVLGKLTGAQNDADKRRVRAIAEYNGAIGDFNDRYGAARKLPVKYTVDPGTKKSDGGPNSTDLKKSARGICDLLGPPQDAALQTKTTACYNEASELGSAALRLESELDLAGKTSEATQTLAGGAIAAASGGFMAHMQTSEAEKQVKKQNEITTRVANQNLELCEGSATADINNAKRNLAQLELDRADTLRDLALRNALAMNEIKSPDNEVPDEESDKTLPPINPGAPGAAKAKLAAAAPNEGGGGGGGAAGGAPGAGGSSGGSPSWNFGGAPGNYLGGGLPNQDAGAQFAAAGGGGAFSGGFGQSGMDLSLGNGALGGPSGPAGERGLASIGDGGLQVMMARMRIRFAYHAGELMQGVDLKSLAQKNSDGSAAGQTKTRVPASKL